MSKQAEKKIPILMYHSISYSSHPKFERMIVSPMLFEKQMAYLSEHQYTPMTVTQLMLARTEEGHVWPEKPVIITFDDGFADFFTNALPILKKYALPATLYIATAFVNGTSRWLHREKETMRRMLTWEQVSEISANGIECGAHTQTHPQLDTMSVSQARQEIELSKKILEEHLKQEILSFAYPFGYHTTRVQQLVREAGFLSACAVKYAMSTENDDPFALARLMAENMSEEDFAARLAGYEAAPNTAMNTLYAQVRRFGWRQVRRSTVAIEKRLSTKREEVLTE